MRALGRRVSAFARRIGLALIQPGRALRLADIDSGRAAGDAAALVLLYVVAVSQDRLVQAGWFFSDGDASMGVTELGIAVSSGIREPLFFLVVGVFVLVLLSWKKRPIGVQVDRACVALVPLIFVHLIGNALSSVSSAVPSVTRWVALAWAGAVILWAVVDAWRRELEPDATDGRRDEGSARWAVAAGTLAAAAWVALGAVNAVDVAKRWDDLKPMVSGTPAPDLSLPRITAAAGLGATVSMRELRGQVVILDFWATWCRPCRKSMPAIQQFAQRYDGRGVRVLSINTEAAHALPAARRMANSLAPGVTLLSDHTGAASRLYRATTIPFVVVIDPSGVVRATHRGFPGARELLENLQETVDPLLTSPYID